MSDLRIFDIDSAVSPQLTRVYIQKYARECDRLPTNQLVRPHRACEEAVETACCDLHGVRSAKH